MIVLSGMENFTESGVYTKTFSTEAIDSIYDTELEVNISGIEVNFNDISSSVFTYSIIDFYDYSSNNIFYDTNILNNCDSTATLNLTIYNSSSSSLDVTACDSYEWNGTVYTESGTYTFNTINSFGCDSLATLNLTINTSSSSNTDVIACNGYLWNGELYAESGVYTFITTNSLGCDSTATLNLTINTSSLSNTDETACESFEWNGEIY